MRVAPATRFSFKGQFAVGLLVAVLFALALGATLIWVFRMLELLDAAATSIGAAAGLALLVASSRRWRRDAFCLRWDGGLWHLAPGAGDDEIDGELVVLLDLGPWMLLRFCAAGTGAAQWISADRGSMLTHWHALRCAVYSPRPAATPDASVDEAAL